MLLDLFITHYKEPWEVGAKAIQMLSLQRLVDWSQIRVTMVHDGTECFPEEYFKGLPFKVHQVSIPHGGIARARNWCIDHSEAKWIKWCDFDDMFSNVFAMKSIMNVLGNDAFDLLWFDLLFEDHGKLVVQSQRNPVFVHDKVFRRQFLLEHEIRFKEDLTWCEDSAFLGIVEMEIDHERIGKIATNCPIYLYIVREGSLCNRPEIEFQNLQSFFVRHCYIADEFLKRGYVEQYNTMCVRIMADSYYTLCRCPNITDDKTEHEAKVWKWYEEHKKPFSECTPENFAIVMEAVNRELYKGGEITKDQVLEWIENHEKGVNE